MKIRTLGRSRPAIESLEARTVPALVAEFNAGVLGIWGTDGADQIVLNQKLGRISIADTLIDKAGTLLESVSALAVRRIEIVGGDGDDQIFLDSQSVGGQSSITRPTKIWAEGGNDWVIGGEGRDTIDAGTGEDVIHGAGGNDYLWGPGAKVWLYGENGNDLLEAESAQAVLDGGNGADTLEVWGTTTAFLSGGSGNDRLTADAGADQMDGGLGNDVMFGYAGDDVMVGGPGNDAMFGGHGSDDLSGEGGTDKLWGGDTAFVETLDDGLDTFRDLFNFARPVYLGAGINDVLQMGSPTCGLLASVGAAIDVGFNFGPSVMPLGNNEYAVFIYDAAADDWAGQTVAFDGTWTDLDANVPRTAGGAILPEFWPVLLQRGYLQFQGVDWSDPAQVDSFRTAPAEAITALTSWASRNVAIGNAVANSLWRSLWWGEAAVASTPDVAAEDLLPGLVPNHSYSIVGMGQISGNWYLQLRNPWGTDFEPSTRPMPQGADDGYFVVWWDDFVENFSGYAVSVT
jgi:Ca2+-binding RTX toxin-like protein